MKKHFNTKTHPYFTRYQAKLPQSNFVPSPTSVSVATMTDQGNNPPPTPQFSLIPPSIDVFHGRQSENIHDFFSSFESLAIMYNTDDAQRKNLLGIFLKSDALEFYNDLKSKDGWDDLTFKEVKDKLISSFTPKLHPISVEFQLASRTQLPSETVRQYFTAKRRLMKSLNPEMSLEKQIFYLTLGLKRELMSKLTNKTFNSIQSLQDYLETFEAGEILLGKRDLTDFQTALFQQYQNLYSSLNPGIAPALNSHASYTPAYSHLNPPYNFPVQLPINPTPFLPQTTNFVNPFLMPQRQLQPALPGPPTHVKSTPSNSTAP